MAHENENSSVLINHLVKEREMAHLTLWKQQKKIRVDEKFTGISPKRSWGWLVMINRRCSNGLAISKSKEALYVGRGQPCYLSNVAHCKTHGFETLSGSGSSEASINNMSPMRCAPCS